MTQTSKISATLGTVLLLAGASLIMALASSRSGPLFAAQIAMGVIVLVGLALILLLFNSLRRPLRELASDLQTHAGASAPARDDLHVIRDGVRSLVSDLAETRSDRDVIRARLE